VRRFTADASHELRTPLTAMRSVGEVALREGRDPERYEETIASMLEETDRLTRLVDGLLLLTREGRAAYRKRFERFDLAALVQESVDLLKVLAEEKEQRAVLHLEPETFVTGDRTTLRQAVVNLIDNAIKYTPRGGTIFASVSMPDAACALIEVADEGPGIPAEHREKVFERFYRVEEGRGRATGGVGLGLAIARWAVELHQGSIELAPESKNGSTFRVRLPLASSARLAAAAEPTAGVPLASTRGRAADPGAMH
jgi:signal transduction histidine kinase